MAADTIEDRMRVCPLKNMDASRVADREANVLRTCMLVL